MFGCGGPSLLKKRRKATFCGGTFFGPSFFCRRQILKGKLFLDLTNFGVSDVFFHSFFYNLFFGMVVFLCGFLEVLHLCVLGKIVW